MTQQKPSYYKISNSRLLRPLLGNLFAAIAIHWTFQGLLYMDRTERLFKLGFDLVITLTLWPIFVQIGQLSTAGSMLAAALAAHTCNFIINGQFWVVAKHFQLVTHSRQEFDAYVREVTGRIAAEPSFRYAAAYGSIARAGWNPSSDLDLRLVRYPGRRNGLRACWFVLRERATAFLRRFPLDIYMLDHYDGLRRMRGDEPPILLKS
jgi:hypothetical protein